MMSPSALLTTTSMSQPSPCNSTSLRMITARAERNAMLAMRIRPRPDGDPPSEQSISSIRSTIVSSVDRSAWRRGEGNIVLRPSSPDRTT